MFARICLGEDTELLPITNPPADFEGLTLLLTRLAGAEWPKLAASWSATDGRGGTLACTADYAQLVEAGPAVEVVLRPAEVGGCSFVEVDGSSEGSFKNLSETLSRNSSFQANSATSPVGEEATCEEQAASLLAVVPLESATTADKDFLTTLSQSLEKALISPQIVQQLPHTFKPEECVAAPQLRPLNRSRPRQRFPASLNFLFNFFQSAGAHARNLSVKANAMAVFTFPFRSKAARVSFMEVVHALRKHVRSVLIKLSKRVRHFLAATRALLGFGTRIRTWLEEVVVRIRRLFRRLQRRFRRLLKKLLKNYIPMTSEFNQRKKKRNRRLA